MSDDLCFLLTILQGNELLKCSFKTKSKNLPNDCIDYYMEYREQIRELLPAHVRSIGPIVAIEPIFEVVCHV